MSSQPGKALKPRGERRQRRHPRYRVEFPVGFVVFSTGERQNFQAHCRDLSAAGIGLLIAAELEMGEVIGLSFSLPALPDLWNIRAVLRYRRGYHYGFEFLSLSEEQSQMLAGYLPSLARADRDTDPSLRKEFGLPKMQVT